MFVILLSSAGQSIGLIYLSDMSEQRSVCDAVINPIV